MTRPASGSTTGFADGLLGGSFLAYSLRSGNRKSVGGEECGLLLGGEELGYFVIVLALVMFEEARV